MLPNEENVKIIFRGVKTAFRDLLIAGAASDWQKIASLQPSTTRREYYPFLGDAPLIQELVGERTAQEVVVHDYALENKIWVGTEYVKVADIEDDTWGADLSARTTALAESVGRFRDENIFGLLLPNAFTTGICYDKTLMINANHPGVYGVQSNIVVPGEGVTPVNPWFLIDGSRKFKPFFWQERIRPDIVVQTRPDAEGVFWEEKIYFGSRERGTAGYGMWQQVVGSKAPLCQETFNAAYQQMQAFTHPDSGRKLGMKPTLLVVGPTNRNAANEVVKAERLANGASNPNWNIVETLNTSWLL